MRIRTLRERLRAGEWMSGTFIKMPDMSLMEVLAQTELDFIIVDAEHAPFGRAERDRCLAIARALDLPTLVRVPQPDDILSALDDGAVGVVVPHVDSAEKAGAVARAAHFGHGGRGFAGSTRWAGFASRTMADVLAQDSETVVIAQIEEPEGVDAAEAIAATDGIDALFAGPADLSVSYGQTAVGSPELTEALARIGAAVRAHGKGYMAWVASDAQAREWLAHGINAFVVGSDHAWVKSGANATAAMVKGL